MTPKISRYPGCSVSICANFSLNGRSRCSGPVHALAITRKLRIPRVIFPIGAGVMSALGLLVSPLGFEIARSRRILLADLGARIRAGVPRVGSAWCHIATARRFQPIE